VAFCPTNPHLLASASDDHAVRLWVAPESAVPVAETVRGGVGFVLTPEPLMVLRALEGGDAGLVAAGGGE
jgi:hypothetical protein